MSADLERDLRAVDDARQRVAPELVGAHRVRPARVLEAQVATSSSGSTVQMYGPNSGDEDVEDRR